MVHLGVQKSVNDEIEKTRPRKIELQKYEAFHLWLSQKPDACWKDVIVSLNKLGQNDLARELTKKYTGWEDPRVSKILFIFHMLHCKICFHSR